MASFIIEHLSEEQLGEAWPLLMTTGAEPVSDWWTAEAFDLLGRGGGILAARASDGSIHGIATYEIVKRGRSGPMLAVARLVTFELSGKEPVKRALTDALRTLGTAFRCSAIALPLPTKGYLGFLASKMASARSDGSGGYEAPSQ